MFKHTSTFTRAGLLAVAAVLGSQGVIARADQIEDNYRKEHAACLNGTKAEEKSACLKEAAAARYEARRGGLTTPSPQMLAANTTRRCLSQPIQDREDCNRRMNGEGTVEGSVAQGAIVRELDTITIAPAAGPSSAASKPKKQK
ncbi:hypothetical protein ACFJGW_19265 [Burkholderiaceae bacterium UC74_6]